MTLEQAFAWVISKWGDRGQLRNKPGGPYRVGLVHEGKFAVMGEDTTWAKAVKMAEVNLPTGKVVRYEALE